MPSRSKRTTGKRIYLMLTTPGSSIRGMARAAVLLALLLVARRVPRPAHAASGADMFRMPSGNIYCAYEHYSFAPIDLRCEIRTKIRPTAAEAGLLRRRGLGRGYSMRQRGPARVLLHHATRSTTANALVLAYGTTRQFGVFRAPRAQGLQLRELDRQRLLPEHRALVHASRKPAAAVRRRSRRPPGTSSAAASIAPDGSASMECGIKSGLKPPPRPIHCDAGDPNDKRVSLRDTGRAAPVLCAGDPGPLLPQIEAKARCSPTGRASASAGSGARPPRPA